ncbi:MAG: hypothetical protein ABI699_09100 [Caldimonas sp.]
MEPFTHDEETALFERLDRLSVAELESYIGSAKNSLGNKALNPTWRPRIEIALNRAVAVHVRAEAAAALLAAEPPVEPAPPVKAKRSTKAAKAASLEKSDKPEPAEAEVETEAEAEADEA